VLLLSLFANSFGIGNPNVFGWQQVTGAILGAVITVAGAVLKYRK